MNDVCNWTGIWELRPLRIQIRHGSKCYFSFVWLSSVASPGKVLKRSSQTFLKVNFMLEKLPFLLSSFYFHGSQFKNKINGKVENITEKNKCFVQWVPNQGIPIRPSLPLALLFLEISILSSKAVIYHPEPPYSSLQPHGVAVVFHTGVLPISRELWICGTKPQIPTSRRSFHFFGICTFKSKLQKKASFSILSVALLLKLQILKSLAVFLSCTQTHGRYIQFLWPVQRWLW